MIDDLDELRAALRGDLGRMARETSVPTYMVTGATVPVSLTMLYDAGILRDPVHYASMWPKIDPVPRFTRALDLYQEGRRRLMLAKVALTDPDALEEDDDAW